MLVNIGSGDKWTHQGHVVKGSQEDSPVQKIEMNIGFKQGVTCQGS